MSIFPKQTFDTIYIVEDLNLWSAISIQFNKETDLVLYG